MLVFVQPTQLELVRFYLFQGKSEDGMKQSVRMKGGANTDRKAGRTSRTTQKPNTKLGGGQWASILTRPWPRTLRSLLSCQT